MLMSNMLYSYVEPASSPYAAESLALFARMFGTPTDTYKQNIDTAIVSLKNNGIWDKLDCCYFFAADSSYNAKLNWKQDAFNCTTFSNIDFSTNAGFFRSAPGSQATVQMGWSLATNAVNFTQNANSAGTYYSIPQAISQYSIVGATYYLYLRPSYQTRMAAYDGGSSTAIYTSDSGLCNGDGLSVVERSDANNIRLVHNGYAINSSLNTQVNSFSSTPYMLVSDVSNQCLQFGYYGANLTDSQHKSLSDIVRTFVFNTQSHTSSLHNGLVAYYKMDEVSSNTCYDFVNGYNGTNTNITQKIGGKLNTAYSYNGSSSKTIVSDTNALDLTTAGGISVWVYPAARSYNYIITKGDDANNKNGYFLILYNNYANITLCNATTYKQLNSSATITANAWSNIVVTWDSGNIYFYVNGVASGSTTTTVTPTASTYNLSIGAPLADTGYFNGRIDEVGIWNRLLTSTEASLLYGAGNGYAYPFN